MKCVILHFDDPISALNYISHPKYFPFPSQTFLYIEFIRIILSTYIHVYVSYNVSLSLFSFKLHFR